MSDEDERAIYKTERTALIDVPRKYFLQNIIRNRRWERHEYPFPHIYAQGVFHQKFYKELQTEFQSIVDKGLYEESRRGMMSRSISGYDAYGLALTKEMGALSVFLEQEWHDTQAALFNVKGTGYVNSGLHYHMPGSLSGAIHTDLNPVWFTTQGGKGRIRTSIDALCDYKTGAGPVSEDTKINVVRGVVVLFYLNNKAWFEGDGGETGLYTGYKDDINNPTKKIPPYDNSLIMYECTPKSFHSFLSNTKKPRSSVIMWVHRPLEEAVEAFGTEHFEYWREGVALNSG